MALKASWQPQGGDIMSATRRVRRMLEMETRGYGDDHNALRRLSEKIGLSFHTLHHLKLGYRKVISSELAGKIYVAYLNYVNLRIAEFREQVEREIGEASETNDALAALASEAEALAAEASRALARQRRGR